MRSRRSRCSNGWPTQPPIHSGPSAQGRPWWKDQVLRVLQRHVDVREGLDLAAIAEEIVRDADPSYEPPFYSYRLSEHRDAALCMVESVCNELVMEGHVDQMSHAPWPNQRYRTASLLELIALAAR